MEWWKIGMMECWKEKNVTSYGLQVKPLETGELKGWLRNFLESHPNLDEMIIIGQY
jgi:hypothetical protein